MSNTWKTSGVLYVRFQKRGVVDEVRKKIEEEPEPLNLPKLPKVS